MSDVDITFSQSLPSSSSVSDTMMHANTSFAVTGVQGKTQKTFNLTF